MSEQLNLENLTNREIADLWAKTTAEAKKQHGAKLEAQLQSGGIANDDYYIDSFGNAIDGPRPAPKTERTYVDSSGYVQVLRDGETAPELSGSNVVDWLNKIDLATDTEVADALGIENLTFQEKLNNTDLWIIGKMGAKGWDVTARSESGQPDFQFRLAKKLTRDEAVAQASGYVLTKTGPQFKQLSENEMRMCERMAVNNRNEALVFYIQARLPDAIADRFLGLGASGNELAIQHFAADEKISEIAEEAVAYTFYWNNPKANDAFFTWVKANDDGRMWTFALLDSLWEQYQAGAIGVQDQPSREDVEREAESMSDAELASVIAEARKLQRQSR